MDRNLASDNFLSRYDLAGLGAEISIFKNLEMTLAFSASNESRPVPLVCLIIPKWKRDPSASKDIPAFHSCAMACSIIPGPITPILLISFSPITITSRKF
jgi:hypothetical protein